MIFNRLIIRALYLWLIYNLQRVGARTRSSAECNVAEFWVAPVVRFCMGKSHNCIFSK